MISGRYTLSVKLIHGMEMRNSSHGFVTETQENKFTIGFDTLEEDKSESQ